MLCAPAPLRTLADGRVFVHQCLDERVKGIRMLCAPAPLPHLADGRAFSINAWMSGLRASGSFSAPSASAALSRTEGRSSINAWMSGLRASGCFSAPSAAAARQRTKGRSSINAWMSGLRASGCFRRPSRRCRTPTDVKVFVLQCLDERVKGIRKLPAPPAPLPHANGRKKSLSFNAWMSGLGQPVASAPAPPAALADERVLSFLMPG